ncbi:MAG: hypothetical protein EOP06_10890 [Proteobacteria bacterium]|nr:MAG: hypothetical protein EOP06_10890 [Pseudomonadota bacterium]
MPRLQLVAPVAASAPIFNRCVALIGARQFLELVADADDADGFTAEELESYFQKVEEQLRRGKAAVRAKRRTTLMLVAGGKA